jgi:alkylation response protein AidB-like acyl-CoA dehydrogenase
MRFAFSDEQLALRDAVRGFLEKECTPKIVRDAWTNADGRSGLWDGLSEMGVVGVSHPDVAGGLGVDEIAVTLILEETGRVALPEPIVEHTAVALPLVAEHHPDAVTASSVFTAGFLSPSQAPALRQRSAKPPLPRGGPLVPYAESATALLLERDRQLYLVDRDAASLTPRTSVDGTRRLCAVEWNTTAATEIGGPDDAALAFDRGALGVAAQLIGLAQHMLDTTVEYAQARHQFGVPIGSFQAVKHHLADVALALEFARPLVYRAAWSLAKRDQDQWQANREPDRSVHVAMAKARASEAALLAGRVALQVHGAIGYTTEYDLHMWLKRAWALAASWGDPDSHDDRVGRAILGTDDH